MRCWACRHPFEAQEIRRDGMLRGRDPQEGGPWRSYRCPQCRRWCCAEELPGGGLYISPERDLAILDYLFGWIDPLAAEDFLPILRWKKDHLQERRQLFETRRDFRYSGGWLGSLLNQLLGRRGRQRPQAHRPDSGDLKGEQERRQETDSRPIPHPFRVLGLPPDASGEEIRSAFKRLVRKYHPDKLQGADDESLDLATRRLKELIEAYEKLDQRSAADGTSDS